MLWGFDLVPEKRIPCQRPTSPQEYGVAKPKADRAKHAPAAYLSN